MNKLKELCEKVLELDAKASYGWTAYTVGKILRYGDPDYKYSSDAKLIAEYRTIAPKLAKVCQKLIEQRDWYLECYKKAMCDNNSIELTIKDNNEQLEDLINE